MLGPLLALTASLSWGLGDFLAGHRTRRLAVVTVLVVSQAAGLTTIALVVAVRGVGAPDARHLLYGALAGIFGAIGLAALYRGLAVGPMSIVAPISATAALVPVAFDLVAGSAPAACRPPGSSLRSPGSCSPRAPVPSTGAERARRACCSGSWPRSRSACCSCC